MRQANLHSHNDFDLETSETRVANPSSGAVLSGVHEFHAVWLCPYRHPHSTLISFNHTSRFLHSHLTATATGAKNCELYTPRWKVY